MNVQQTLDAIMAVIQEPTSNLTAFALIAAAFTLAALIAILTAIMWLTAPLSKASTAEDVPPEHRDERKQRQPVEESRTTKLLWTGSVAALVLVAFVAGYVGTGSNQFCLDSCHSDLVSSDLTPAAHDGIDCTACHEDSLPLGLVTNPVNRVLHAIPAGEDEPRAVKPIPASRCIACHEESLSGTITSDEISLRMSHSEPIEAGMSCEDCHKIGVHGSAREPVEMSTCSRCHDAKTVSADCDVCHIGDPADAARNTGRLIVREVTLPRIQECGGCHEQDTCDECHGLRLPHSREFIDGEHAPLAAFDRKPLCWRCHQEEDCGMCHGNWNAHGRNFKYEHQRYPRDASCGRCHRGHTGPFCNRCHLDW
jgi:hypothetical protein